MIVNITDLLSGTCPRTSRDRLLSLQPEQRCPNLFFDAAEKLRQGAGIEITRHDRANTLPLLSPESSYAFREAYLGVTERFAAGEVLSTAVARQHGMVIGFAIASLQPHREIEIIEVEDRANRFSGLKEEVAVGREIFTVGVGHLLVARIVENMERPITTNASHHSAQYLFLALGFRQLDPANDQDLILD